jgi:CubicO group peptidase (beta-lactamase class C family)
MILAKTLAVMVALGLSNAVPMSVPSGAIDDVIDREMSSSGVPGLAYAAVVDGEITSVGARGVVRLGGETAVTPETPFLTGSISKSFTALSVMQLVEAGEIHPDDPFSQHLGDFSSGAAQDITVRQLLSHTSGYSTLQGNVSHTDRSGGTDELARRVDQLASAAPAHAVGEWEYSNTNYQILGRVVEVVSGQDYQSYVAEHILEPIGMRNSFVADGEVHPSMATGHRPWFGTKRPFAENRTYRGTAPQGGDRRERQRPGPLPADDDERPRRRAERRRQVGHDAAGQRSIALLRPGLVRGLGQRNRLALRNEPRLRNARHDGAHREEGRRRARQRRQRSRVR